MTLPLAFVSLLLGGAVGLFMAVRSFRGKSIPIAAPVIHGIFNVTGLVALLVAVCSHHAGRVAAVGLVTLIAAALGGAYLLSFHLRSLPHPRSAIVAHAAVAIIGVLTVLIAITHGVRF